MWIFEWQSPILQDIITVFLVSNEYVILTLNVNLQTPEFVQWTRPSLTLDQFIVCFRDIRITMLC